MIKNIIFDQGGIFLNIDYTLTIKAFQKLGASSFHEVYTQHGQSSLFDLYDIGKISSADFRAQLKSLLNISHVSDADFDKAWSAMLLDVPLDRLTFLKTLSEKYRLFLFSNANEIHMTAADTIFEKHTGNKSITHYFEKAYYSQLCGFRKPKADSFSQILEENNLKPHETLFIDDNMHHIKSADSLRMQTLYIPTGNCFIEPLVKILEASSSN